MPIIIVLHEYPINDPRNFRTISKGKKEIVLKWIGETIQPRGTANTRHSSYGLKHIFDGDKANGGFYMTNGQFKGAMLEAGFKPVDPAALNWIFRISERSPCFDCKVR